MLGKLREVSINPQGFGILREGVIADHHEHCGPEHFKTLREHPSECP
jgi:hypothetical protein